MKQNSLIRRKKWDVLIVIDTSSPEQMKEAVEEAGVSGELVVANSRWPDMYQWFERNWYQFEDGRNHDVSFVSQHRLPWLTHNLPWLNAWGKAIPSWQKRKKNKLEATLDDARRELRNHPDKKVFAYICGGGSALPAAMEFAKEHSKEFDVAISARLNPDGGTLVPWLWVHMGPELLGITPQEDGVWYDSTDETVSASSGDEMQFVTATLSTEGWKTAVMNAEGQEGEEETGEDRMDS